MFERLIGVSGIGPRSAQVILSGMAPDDLAAAIAASDVARLTTIPGVGKKTAERMVVELRDRMQELDQPERARRDACRARTTWSTRWSTSATGRPTPSAPCRRAPRRAPTAEFHELLRLSLKRLSRV